MSHTLKGQADLDHSLERESLAVLVAFMQQACTQRMVRQLLQLYASLQHELDMAEEFYNASRGSRLMFRDPLQWCLMAMGYDDGKDSTLRLFISLDSLDHYIRSNSEVKSRLTSGWIEGVADISTLNNSLEAMSQHRGPVAEKIYGGDPATAGLIRREMRKIDQFVKLWRCIDAEKLSPQGGPGLRSVTVAVENLNNQRT
jgi:hypothetical protein